MPDINGRPYKTILNTKEGDLVELDGGFTCIHEGARRRIYYDDHLYFKCCEGRHYLCGQLNDAGEFVGVYIARDNLS